MPTKPPRAPLDAPAKLRLTSDLPATVSIAGKPVGSTPQQVERQAGLVAVSFLSRELGEKVETTVELAAGQTLGVHAEFTRARPAVSLR
jgi:Tfp pilus assembly protein PilZ